MNKSQKSPIVVITANSWRHRYVANRLIENFDVRGIVSEVKRPLRSGETPEENQIILEHSRERDLKEQRFFGTETGFNLPESQILKIDYGTLNEPRVFDWVTKHEPRYIALFGSSLLKDPLLGNFHDRVINMHLGLSPYYRGSATSFWPFVLREPECLGVTVHLAVSKVDAGAILGQVRPPMAVTDGLHEIGNKNIIAGTELLIRCLKSYAENKILPQPQRLDIGRVFKHQDFNAQAVLHMKENFRSGMIKEYLHDQGERHARYPIIEN